MEKIRCRLPNVLLCNIINIMITLIYYVTLAEKNAEIEWLRNQKIYPAIADHWDWKTNTQLVKFGAIVNPESALAIKLRHKLELQADYRQR